MFKKYNRELEVINTFMNNNPKCTTDQLANTIQMVILRISNYFVDYNMCYEAAQGLLDLYDNPELTDEEMTELIEDDYRYPDEDEDEEY
jgi:hypothetical protein